MVKNIVLVTWKGAGNYGTCLQSYALYRKLENLGYSVRLLSGKPKKYTHMHYIRWFLGSIGLKRLKNLIIKRKFQNIQEKKRYNFQQNCFKDVVLYTKIHERQLIRETDCFITGSDQIWNTYYNFNPFFFLSFAGEAKRIAYASSIGTDSIKEEYLAEVKELLLKFCHIGVREQKAVKVLSELTGRKDICQVLDPTFLLTPEDWTQMSNGAVFESSLPKNFILCYLIGNNELYSYQLEHVKEKTGINEVVIVPSAENPEFNIPHAFIYRYASPVEFVWLIQHASFVCTDSFHATALSINHSIPFVEFIRFKDTDEKSQNSRIYDVLKHYGLLNRIFTNKNDTWSKRIDYTLVQSVLAVDRKSSLDYLVNAIEN